MKRKQKYTFIGVTLILLALLTGCKKDDNSFIEQNVTGCVQKGPFINGSSVTVYDLLSDLSPSGKTYNSQISDNIGSFELNNISLSSDYISLKADGFYFNEISGKQSVSQLTLYAISDISNKEKINVNILTHLEKARVEYLIKNGKSFTGSKAQAQKEILAIFNIEKNDIKSSESLDISESGDDNGILLAITSILQGYRSEGELTELLSNISNDIKEDGIIDSAVYGSALINHAIFLDTALIKDNLAERYNAIGATISIPDFSNYITNFISETDFPVTESLINYPETGYNGVNVLSLSRTEITAGESSYVSLAAELPNNMSLKIKITSLGSNYWFYDIGSIINWSITTFDMGGLTQTFTAIHSDASCDLKMFFLQGTYLIEYYEMNSDIPTRSKTLIAN